MEHSRVRGVFNLDPEKSERKTSSEAARDESAESRRDQAPWRPARDRFCLVDSSNDTTVQWPDYFRPIYFFRLKNLRVGDQERSISARARAFFVRDAPPRAAIFTFSIYRARFV